ncbi:MAG TPA: putative peptidoglycan glycosyltransferase FtsW [Bacteroidota bacterium]|jgi:cell division protein FtsW|nr:putative peptidoglycan glycosyltransferase FtsW [Bacteroidota bacterium]
MFATQRNHIDVAVMISVLTLMLLSLGIVYSASSSYAFVKYGESEKMLLTHAVKVLLGIIGMFVAMRIDYHKVQRFTKLAVIGAVGLLMITLVLGGEAKGATRWLRFGSLGFQPSEFAKYALLFHLCTLIAVKDELIQDFRRGFVPMMVWIGSITLLVMLQPNFSMGSMIFLLSLVMLFMGRARLSHLGLTFAVLVPVILLYMMSAEYRRARIMAFLSGSNGAGKSHYQLWQGILGFGNGGIFGVGPGESRQRDFFLPESYGDFVFSIVGEEYGFIGTMFFMSLFAIIMIRGFKIAKYAADSFGRNLAIAITSAITLYALINAGVTLGILPTTGLPMPFVSYGGSSMVFSACAIGVLLNISSQTDLHPRARTSAPAEAPQPVVIGQAVAGKVY